MSAVRTGDQNIKNNYIFTEKDFASEEGNIPYAISKLRAEKLAW